MQPDITLSFDTLPSTPLHSLFRIHRGKTLPIIQATCSHVTPFDVQRYNEICNFTIQREHLAFTYPQLLAAPLHYQIVAHPQFPFPAIGLVHVEQHITYHSPIPNNTSLSIITWCDNLHQVRSGHHFSLHTEVYHQEKLLWKGESVVLTRKLEGHKGKKIPAEKKDFSYSHTKTCPVPENQGRIYAGVSKDWNLIHVHWTFAKLFGFQRAIVHGMWTLAIAISWAEEQGLVIEKCHAKFVRPVFLPSTIKLALHKESDTTSYLHILREKDEKKHLQITLQTSS